MPVTISLAAEAVVFAINSAIKLSNNVRRSYALSIRSKDLVLPLPAFDMGMNLTKVIPVISEHLEGLSAVEKGKMKRVVALHDKAQTDPLNADEREEYLGYYYYFKEIEEGNGGQLEMDASDLAALFTIRQWEKDEKPDTVLQLVAGSLVEIGIDYFNQFPGVLNPDSAHGRLMQTFLSSFNDIKITDNGQINKNFSAKLVPRLFVVAAESLADLSPEMASDKNVQAIIQATARGLAEDLNQRIEGLDEEEAVHWGQLILRSTINHAGHFVFQSPQSVFGTDESVSKIIESSGLVLLETILGDDPDKLDFKNVLSPDSLDRLVGATLGLIAEHPDMIRGNQGVREIIAGVATAMQNQSLLEKGYLPELIRIVLEQSAGRLDLLWKEKPGTDGAEHVLVLAIGQLLGALSEKQGDETWRPALTNSQLMGILGELLEDVAQNPAWIMEAVGDTSAMAQVLETTFRAMRAVPKEERLNAEMVHQILRLNLETTLINPKVLEKVHWGTDEEETAVMTKALDLIFSCVFSKEVPPIVRLQLLTNLLEYAATVILRQHSGKKGLILLDLILFRSGIDYSQGFDRQLTDQIVNSGLEALASHPELLAKPEALQQILSGVADALDSAKLKQPGLASRLVQLVLFQTGQNAHLLIDAGQDQPRHLLLSALKQLLSGLSAADNSGNWKPGINAALAENLIESLLDEVVQHPYWISEKVQQNSLLKEVLEVVFQALETIPKQERLSPETLKMLLPLSLRVVSLSPSVLQKVRFADDDTEKEILRRALDLVFAYVFSNESDKSNRMLLLWELMEFVLEALISKYPDKRGLILADLVLFEHNGIDYSQGFQPGLARQLADAALTVLSQKPELITNDQMLRQIIANVAAALHASGLEQPNLLPELIRLTLESTAEHIDLLWSDGPVNTHHLFVMATRQSLSAIAQPTEDGKWKPRLSDNQIIEIINLIYETIIKKPQWALQDSRLFKLMEAVFRALQGIPEPYTIPYALILSVIEEAIQAVDQQWELLAEIQSPDGTKQLRLQFSLEKLIVTLYQENPEEKMAWYLSQGHIARMLFNHYLMRLANTPANPKDIEAAQKQIRQAIAKWKQDSSQNLAEILEKMT